MARKKADERVKLSFGGSVVEVKADSAERFLAAGAQEYTEPTQGDAGAADPAQGNQGTIQVQAGGDQGGATDQGAGDGASGQTNQGTVEDKAVTRGGAAKAADKTATTKGA